MYLMGIRSGAIWGFSGSFKIIGTVHYSLDNKGIATTSASEFGAALSSPVIKCALPSEMLPVCRLL